MTILFFGKLAEMFKVHEMEMDMNADGIQSVGDVIANLEGLQADFRTETYTVALNEQIIAPNDPLHISLEEMDVVAILPPFAGG